MDAIVFKAIVGAAEARDFDARTGTERHGDKLVHDGNLRVALVAANDGIGQVEPRESPALTCIVLRLNG